MELPGRVICAQKLLSAQTGHSERFSSAMACSIHSLEVQPRDAGSKYTPIWLKRSSPSCCSSIRLSRRPFSSSVTIGNDTHSWSRIAENAACSLPNSSKKSWWKYDPSNCLLISRRNPIAETPTFQFVEATKFLQNECNKPVDAKVSSRQGDPIRNGIKHRSQGANLTALTSNLNSSLHQKAAVGDVFLRRQ